MASNDLCQLCLQSQLGIGSGFSGPFRGEYWGGPGVLEDTPACVHLQLLLSLNLSPLPYSHYHREYDWSI
jgi:hypothetical protein